MTKRTHSAGSLVIYLVRSCSWNCWFGWVLLHDPMVGSLFLLSKLITLHRLGSSPSLVLCLRLLIQTMQELNN